MSARGLRSIARDVEEGRIQGAEVAKKLEDAAAEVDALKGDRFIYRIVVVALGIVAVAAVIGTILVLLIGAAASSDGALQVLTALGSAAVGAMAGLLAPSPRSSRE
ncbi:MAG TPA: hypothetical protein PK593_08705 [Thermomicrobiales bacterium]|nr:hypothetical protein [Thermomicrobiales bacterium]